MLRASSYVIYVPLPENTDEMLLVHGYTGAFDKVSTPVGEYIRSLETDTLPKPLHGEWVTEPAVIPSTDFIPTPSDETIAVLERRGYLTSMEPTEEEGYLAKIVKKMHQFARHAVPSYIFMPTYNCNLRCAYCFQDHMRTNPKFQHLLRTMSFETVDRIVAAYSTIERSHGIEDATGLKRSVGFFGGEPLLAGNRPVVEHIMLRTRELGPARFWAVSNATELDAYDSLLGPAGIEDIQITLDGPPEEHNKRRIYPDGHGSFALIAKNIDLCLDRGVNVSVRMNIDRANISQVPELAETIVKYGWDKRKGFSTYTAPITNSEQAISLKELQSRYFNSWELDQAIDDLRATHESMRVIGRPDDKMIARVRRLFDQHADTPDLKSAFCGAHTGMYIFDSFGDIYACWERTGDPSVRIGRVLDGGELEINEGMTRLWRTRTPASNPVCRKCRYALNCEGGCAVLAEGRSGMIHSNYCDGFAERFRNSVAAAYGSFVSGEVVADQARVCDL